MPAHKGAPHGGRLTGFVRRVAPETSSGRHRLPDSTEECMKILGMGVPELLIILVVILLIFGPKNLPKLGSALGKTVKNLRDGMGAGQKEVEEAADDDEVVEVVEEVVEEPVEAPKKTVKKVVKKKAE